MNNKRTNEGGGIEPVNQSQAFIKGVIKDSYSQYLFLKIDRLNRAAYLITSNIPDEEPLKRTLRSSNLKMARLFNDYLAKSKKRAGDQAELESLLVECSHVCQIVDLGKHAGLLSPMNADIISGEYADLAHSLMEHVNRGISQDEDSNTLSKDFFDVEVQKDLQFIHKGQNDKNRMSLSGTLDTKGQIEDKKTESKGHSLRTKERSSPKAKARMGKIMNLLKEKGDSPIKDIYAEFKDVSKKTIQRDLSGLVESGAVAKKGEKRWSVYFLS